MGGSEVQEKTLFVKSYKQQLYGFENLPLFIETIKQNDNKKQKSVCHYKFVSQKNYHHRLIWTTILFRWGTKDEIQFWLTMKKSLGIIVDNYDDGDGNVDDHDAKPKNTLEAIYLS